MGICCISRQRKRCSQLSQVLLVKPEVFSGNVTKERKKKVSVETLPGWLFITWQGFVPFSHPYPKCLFCPGNKLCHTSHEQATQLSTEMKTPSSTKFPLRRLQLVPEEQRPHQYAKRGAPNSSILSATSKWDLQKAKTGPSLLF